MRYNSPKANAGAQQSRWCFGWLMVVVYALDSIHVQYCKPCRCPSGAWRCSLPLSAPLKPTQVPVCMLDWTALPIFAIRLFFLTATLDGQGCFAGRIT